MASVNPNSNDDELTIRQEANAIVAIAFRNGPLEELHCGRYSKLLEDPTLSRITDEEMKSLMINACDVVERLLRLKESDPGQYRIQIKDAYWRYCQKWK